MDQKPLICVDFDGVLNNYQGYDEDDLGNPRPGAELFLKKLSYRYRVVILSARRYTTIIKWLVAHNLWDYVVDVTSYKPPAVAYIDDRAIQFNGDYDEVMDQLKNFKPHWK